MWKVNIMYKSKRQKNKSFDWYGLSQRFSIRKYHFGAASVLLGTALILGAAQTTAKAEETATENKTEAVASAPKDDKVSENVANVTTPALSATTEAAVVEKPTLSDEEVAKLAAEASKKDEKVAETATTEKTEAADKEKATLTAPSTDKKADKAVDEKADKKDEKKAENPITATKTVLEQLTSEAEVLNTTASNFADKKAEDKAGKEAIATAVASAKVQIEASKKALAAGEITKQELDAQLQRISSAIEAVYAEMKRAGHVGKVEAVLADAAASAVNINNPINKVVVNDIGNITEEEARAIEKEIRTANPTLTADDKIEVKQKGDKGVDVATVTLANGKVDQNGSRTHGFAVGDVVFGSAGEKNYNQLREAINWFDFATASITYNDGTKVGPVEYVDNPAMINFTSSKGRQESGRFTMVRTVLESKTHPELVGKKTNDPAFLASVLAKYTLWKTFNDVKKEVQNNQSSGRGDNEIFEVLQEGMRFDVPTKVKGYALSATVKSLSRKKVTTETYTLNKANGEPENINRAPIDGVVQREDVIVTRQDPKWSHLRLAGFPTTYVDSKGIERERLTAFAPAYDGGNVGVKFQLAATYNGRPVAVNAIAADSEDLNEGEFTQFESDGTPWEEFMRLNKNKTNSQGILPNREGNTNFLSTFDRKTNAKLSTGYDLSEWTNKTETGYGSQLFGPFVSGITKNRDLPVGISQNVENLGVYINAPGSQSASVGFVVYDGGDAPASYGSAQHIIGNFNKEKNGTQVTATQPYLGDVPADTDFRTTIAEPNGAWVLDDLVNSEDYKEINLVSGTTQVTNSKGQSGTYLLDGKNPVIRMGDGTQVAIKNGEILSTANTLEGGDGFPIKGLYNQATRGLGVGNLPDEFEGQLLDPTVATKYTLRHASENEYVLKGVKVNRGVNNDVAYVRGWVDFNGNGKFDLYESSELVTANADGTYDITFKNAPQLLNTSVDNLGVRLRVSVDQNDLRLPTGLASSGEVEDFVVNVIHPPRGTRHETKDFQGKKQEVNFPTNAMFTASGKTIESNYKQWAQIDNNTAPKMVLNDTVVKSEEPTGKTVEVKDKLSQTIYNGTEVVVKDARGNTLGTAVKVTNKLTGKIEYYLSEYTEYDTAGNKVGVYKLNEGSAEGKNTTQGSLNFTKISFQPEAGFVGTAKGVAIRAWDDNGSHTGWEATEDSIKESLTSTTLADKDKILENVNNGNNGAKSMDTSYIPTVIDVRPVGEDTTTEDVQGKEQKSNPTIPVYGTVETVTNDKVEDVKYTADYVILDKTKKPTFATRKETPAKLYTEDTKVDKETTLTLTDGTTVTYKPVDKIPAGTKIANTGDVNVTGTGNVAVNNIRLVTGTLIPAGAKPQSNHPAPVEVKVTLANGTEQTIPAGRTIPAGATINTPFTNSANNTFDNVTYNTGQTIPRETGGKISTLANETSANQLVEKGKSITLDGTTYSNNDVIPKGTRTVTTYEDLTPNTPLPNAVHIDPETGEVTSVPRRYTKVTDTEIVIENEGTYTLNQDTGEITFTPVPKFVGTGTGVTKQQPDVDYNDKVAGDPVTSKYGTDYGKATYTPIVKPQSKASITRTIHYVYENANDNPSSQDSYKDNDPIVAIDNTPVTRTQTIDYTRDYKIFSEEGTTDSAITTTNQVTDAAGHVYKVGQTIPAGTKFNQGTIIIGKWTASSDENSKFKEIISPTVKGYTAEVVTADFTPRADGKMGHIHNGKQPVGLYTPVADNTKDVGAYEPLVSEVRSDNKDDFDMYVVYKADKQKANVTYIDLDATGAARILEIQTANAAPATGADAKTTYNVEKLQGKSHTKIPYLTADTIKKYEDLGYELVTDDYSNDAQGNNIADGRTFDNDKDVDQPFNVYLRHKKTVLSTSDNETRTVTRYIDYVYADKPVADVASKDLTDEIPADRKEAYVKVNDSDKADRVKETLTFTRTRSLDLATTSRLYPEEFKKYNDVVKASGENSKAAEDAKATLFKFVESKAKEANATEEAKTAVSYGKWEATAGKISKISPTTGAETEVSQEDSDRRFNNVTSPTVPGYLPDNALVEATADIDPESSPDKLLVTVKYSPVDQKAVVKFVEVDPTNTNKVITPGLADPIAVTGKSEVAYPAATATSVTDKIAELFKKGYELVENGFKSTDKFDKDAAVDQEYVVKFKAKVVDVPSFDPTKPSSDDNPKPTPGVTPIDPNNPDGPKWTEELIKAVKVQEEVTRTIKYVYEDGTPVAESDLTSVADKKVKTLKFTRSGKINVATGEITYGDWSANQTFEAVTSPVLEKYTAAVAGVTPTTPDVPEKTVSATDKDFEEVVVYKTKLITVDPKAPGYKEPKKDEPINPNDPNGPKWTDELLAKLKNTEEVTRTISYTYSTEASELNQAEKDGNKGGTNVAEPFTTKVNYTRVAKVNPVTGEITYGEWEAKDNDTTLEGNTLPAVAGYVATGDVEKSTKPVENVKAEDKDITEKVVYKALGKYVPVVPEGFTPPTIENPQYPNNPTDPTKPGTPTTTIPYVPGTTPVGPDGQPLTPKVPGDPKQGYEPPVPTTPTGDTTIVYTKDGSQVAVTKFVDTTGKGLEPSVVDTGDTGKPFTKDADVTAAINKILARGYEKVANVNANEKDYPSTDAEKVFDADAKTNQEYTVTFKPIVKDIPTDPTTPGYVKPEPGQPVDPTKPDGPKWPESVKDLKTTESVTRTIKYVYEDATPVPDAKLGTEVSGKKVQTLEFTRTAKVNLVTGEVEYGTWTPKTTADFEAVPTPTIDGYTSALVSNPTTSDVPAKTVTADAADFEEVVVYKTKQITIDPNDPNFDPEKPVDPNNPNGPKYKDLKLAEEVKRTITYTYADDVADTAKRGTEAEPKHETTVSFTRTATVNAVTKEITYSEWTPKDNDTTLEGKATVPVKTGYVATGDVESSKKDVTGVNATDKDIVEAIVYKDLGKFVPKVPEGFTPPTIENPQYPNNPDDPTKPGTPTTTIPYVPGTTPVGPNGQPLTPKDPNDKTKGYNPPTPTNPTEDTTIVYTKDGSQVAVTKFVDTTGKGLEPSVVDTGDTGKPFTKDADVTAAINKILARGYEKVANVNANEKDYPSTDAEKVFDADAKTNQEFTVTFKPIVKEVPVDPATPGTKPQPGQPVDPSNPDGPKWPSSVKDLKNSDTVKRTIKYVYEDGTPVIDPATGAQKVVEQTAEFTRTANVNLVTGDITYGDWTPAKELAPVASPTATDIPAVANYIASVATVPAVTIAAEADDITETVVYRQAKPVTITPTDSVPNDDPSTPVDPNNPIQPGKPIDPNNPDGPKWTKDLIDKLRDARSETVTRTITYKYSTETSELKAEDAAKAGQNAADTVTNTVTFKRPVTIDPITKEFTYGDWEATNGTTLAGKADLPVVAGYVATGDVEASKKDVTDVKATDKDITENVVYKTVGKYVPVIPEGITPPANTNVDPKPYNNDPQDGSKVKDPNPTNPVVPGTTTPIVPQIPGTTPVGPDGKPLKPVDSNDLSKGYVPPTPTDPTKDTSIIYVKDGSQVAVVHFVDEKGNSVNESVVETGDTGKEISKSNVDKVKAALEAKGYEVVAPTDALYTTDKEGFYKEATRTFDAVSDKATGAADEKVPSQQYYVIVKGKELPVDPTKPLDPNNNPVDPTNPTPENPTTPRDPETPVTPKPEDKVPNDPKGRTYGELGLVEQVTRTINYVKNDGSKAAEPVKETLTFTRKAKINAVTGEVTYLDNDGNATTKEAAPWTPANNDSTFDKVTSPSVPDYTPTRAEVPAKENVTATDEDIVETVVYNPTKQTVDPNAPKDPSTPDVTPKPNDVVPNDPKGRTYKELGLIEEVTRTVHYVYEDGTKAAEDKVQTITFTRTAEIDTVTGAISNFGTWTLKDENNTFEPETTEAKDGYIASAAKSTEVTGVQATDKDTEETIIYRKLGSYVPVVPAGVTPPADFDKTPKPYPNATPEDPTRPGTPTTPTTTIPEIPGTTPVGPDGTPLTKNPNGGYDLPPVPTDPTQNTTITYVKDGSQVAVTHFIEVNSATDKTEKGAVATSIVDTGDTGKAFTKGQSVTDTINALKAKGYTVVENGYPENGTFDSDATTNQEYKVLVTVKEIPVTPDDVTPTPDTPIDPNNPNGPKWTPELIKELEEGRTEDVKRTIKYIYSDGTAVEDSNLTSVADKKEKTLTFKRSATINPVTGKITFGNWKPAKQSFEEVTSPTIEGYIVDRATVPAKEVTEASGDITEVVVYKKLGSYVPVVPEGVTVPPGTDTTAKVYPKDPTDPTRPGTPTTVIPHIPGVTPLDPSTGKPLEPVTPGKPEDGYKVPPVPTDPTQDTNIVYAKDGSQVSIVHFVDEDGNAVHTSFAEAGDVGSKFTKAGEVAKIVTELEKSGYSVVPNKAGQAEYPGKDGEFDSVDDKGENEVSQVYYVTVAKPIPVTPTNPQNPKEDPKNPKPGDPIDPNKPDGPKWTEDALNKLNNIKTVTRTITYVKADTDEEVSPTKAPKVTDKVSFTRTAIVNPKDGSLVGYDTNGDGKADVPATDTDSGWKAVNDDTTFDKVTSPVVPGYVLKNAAQKEVAATTGLTPKSDNENIKVEYVPVGTWTPKVPDGETPIDPIPYPNDPKDPGKVVDPNDSTTPNDPNKPSVPVIPHIPGTTPKDPNGNPLKPVDPADPSKGYVPPTPKTPTENTVIEYVKDIQKATVKYVVAGTNTVLHTDELEGKSGEPINYSTATKLAELKELGYDLVTDGFTTATDKNYDKDTKVDQSFVVTVTPHVEPIKPFDPTNPNDPNTPKPGQPIDPNNPDGPKWTEELIKSLDTTKHVNRTISYVDKDGNKVEYTDKDGNKSTSDVTDKVTFTREAKINLVTGKIEYGKWTPVNNDTTFDKVTSPVVPGYVLKDPAQKEVAETTGLTENSKDETIKVVYVPVGTWVPNVPKGETPIDPIPYPNDPKDPGKVVDPNDPTNPNDPNKPSVPVIPHIPGTTPKDPNGNPLKPVDPEDPTKGYVPPTPTTPTENTEINYEKDTQKAVTKFVDPSGNPIPGVTNIEETGKSGEPLTKATEVTTEIAKLIAKGYVLVSNNYGKDNNGNFDKDSGKDQEYTVVLIPHVEPIKPFDPTNPDDPNTPKPGQPIDPNNPDGPKWTEELINKLETTKHVTRKITYVEDGTDKEVADKATDKVTFTREAKINVVTGTIEYGKWTPVNNDTTFDKVTSPVVPGYVLKDPAQKEVAETTGLTENSKDETIKVVYVPVGRLVPKVPEGVTPPTPTPYDNDPQDPGKVVPPSPTKPTDPQDPNSPKVPVIPHIPGTTPKVPQDPTKPVDPNTNPLVPLKPVDPKDPSKGYEVPPVPTDPGTDTPIVYENDKQKAITNFVDNNGKVVSDPVVDQGDSGSKFTKSGDVESKIKELVKKGYVVTSNDYPSADTDRVFDNDKDKDQIFNVKVTPLIVPTDPNSPDQPQVPTDPTKPVGPNNPLKPVTPSTPEPGKPVFPEDPNSPVWPETVKDMVTETTATRTITYVDRNGKEVAATHTETIKFKRTAKVNLVTGDITYGEWIVVGNDTILDGNKLPKVDGYIARGGDIESSQKDIKATAGVNITERVVYDKLGSWIPKLPEGQTQVPPTPYPNDPTDPTKPGTDRPRVPYVPGFIPVDPNGNPLKPVDPNDPTKGYEVPVVPADPTQDTPIKYIPVPKPNNGGGNNGGGGGNTPTPQPQPNPTPQPEPSPAPNPVPVTPETPEQPVVPVAPEQPAEPATPQYMDGQRELPNTGTEAHSSLAALGLLGALSGFGLIARKKRKDEE